MGASVEGSKGPDHVIVELLYYEWEHRLKVSVPKVDGEDPKLTVAKYLGLITSGGSMDGSDTPKLDLRRIFFRNGRSVAGLLKGK